MRCEGLIQYYVIGQLPSLHELPSSEDLDDGSQVFLIDFGETLHGGTGDFSTESPQLVSWLVPFSEELVPLSL